MPTLSEPLLWTFTGTVLLCALMIFVVYHKVRRVHLATYKLVEEQAHARRELEWLFCEIQSFLALDRLLALSRPLPLLRGWAGSPDFLLAVATAVRDRKPRVVVECGSGASTLVIARCLELNGEGHLYSLEHDSEFGERTRRLVDSHELQQWATVLEAPLGQDAETNNIWYRDGALPADAGAIDMLVVDGPPGTVGSKVRAPAFSRLRSRFANALLIIVDDADRPDESSMVKQWCELDPTLRLTRVPAEKGLVFLEREP